MNILVLMFVLDYITTIKLIPINMFNKIKFKQIINQKLFLNKS